jgi:hypothetical protein
MDTFDNWHLVRGLVVLLAFCLFVFFAFLAGVWQNWNAKRQARRMTEQDQSLSVEPKMARGGEGRAAERQPAQWEERPVADPARRAA